MSEEYYHNLADQYVNSEYIDYGYHNDAVKDHIKRAFLAGIALQSPSSAKDTPDHLPLPEGLYKYGEPYASGVRPVYGAHQQLLWYSVPDMSTRFTDLEEAENVVFTKLKSSPVSVDKQKNQINKYMYTLRTIQKGGLETNTSLGEQYFYADRQINGGEDFRTMYKEHFRDEVFVERCVGLIRDERGNVNAVWADEDTYVMTDSGKTFSRLNRSSRND
jgi:hypothetical protein